MNTTQFIWNNQGFCENPNFEGFEIINNFNFEGNYGSMLGLIDEESLNKPPPERGHKEEGSRNWRDSASQDRKAIQQH